jgi:hypothetical protein
MIQKRAAGRMGRTATLRNLSKPNVVKGRLAEVEYHSDKCNNRAATQLENKRKQQKTKSLPSPEFGLNKDNGANPRRYEKTLCALARRRSGVQVPSGPLLKGQSSAC